MYCLLIPIQINVMQENLVIKIINIYNELAFDGVRGCNCHIIYNPMSVMHIAIKAYNPSTYLPGSPDQ